MRRVVLPLLGGALAASCVFAWAGRDYLQDSWWMWRLRSPDAGIRLDAAQRLGARKCLRAVPEIVRLIALDPGENVTWHLEQRLTAMREGGGACGNDFRRFRKSTPLVLVLWDMGEAALPIIERASCRMNPGEEKMRRIFLELSNREEPLDRDKEVERIVRAHYSTAALRR